MAGNRLATSYLKTGIIRRLRSEFNATRVPGITEIPSIVQDRIIDSLPYPIIYVDISSVDEIDVTKTGSGYEYIATINVLVKTTQNEDGKRLRDAISDEVVNILDCPTDQYINLEDDGFSVYVQTVESPSPIAPLNAYGSTFWNSEIDIRFRASFVGTPEARIPIQQAIYTYEGFTFEPTGNRVELYDSGDIVGASVYPSNNNGWNWIAVTYSTTAGTCLLYTSPSPRDS